MSQENDPVTKQLLEDLKNNQLFKEFWESVYEWFYENNVK